MTPRSPRIMPSMLARQPAKKPSHARRIWLWASSPSKMASISVWSWPRLSMVMPAVVPRICRSTRYTRPKAPRSAPMVACVPAMAHSLPALRAELEKDIEALGGVWTATVADKPHQVLGVSEGGGHGLVGMPSGAGVVPLDGVSEGPRIGAAESGDPIEPPAGGAVGAERPFVGSGATWPNGPTNASHSAEIMASFFPAPQASYWGR